MRGREILPHEVLENYEALEKKAEEFGKELREKERQIRTVFATVLESKDLAMVKPRVRYQAAREKKLKNLAEFVEKLVDEIRKRRGEEFEKARERLLNFLEAVVAYAKYYKEVGK